MKEGQLRTLSIEFAGKMLQLVKVLKAKKETILANQIARSGTSVGANIHEAQYCWRQLNRCGRATRVGLRVKRSLR